MSWMSTLTWEDAQRRAEILDSIRVFFKERKVVEVETPALSQGTITDVHLDALSCDYNYMEDSSLNKASRLYLQTSPEFHMKRLLASGYQSIFQIAKSFRHEGAGRFHNPEFTMLEWYRVGLDHFELMDEVSDLLCLTLACEKPYRISYQEIFKECTGIDPLATSREQLSAYINLHGKLDNWLIESSKEDGDNDMLLQFIFSEFVENRIGSDAPCFVYDFPVSQASLAKVSSQDKKVAHRFECYFQGIELANGFNELTDGQIQLKRFNTDNTKRSSLGLDKRAIDDNFIQALNAGIPDCSGVALGIDRLVMIALSIGKIENVISFPINNA
ncbi:MAG: elongation factor P--(R)-beta-lysine ligase [Colwellia sp.]